MMKPKARDYLAVYITAKDRTEALKLGRWLVRERLAACANILGPVQSVYRWKGRVEEAGEAALLAKTTGARWPELVRRVKERHSYETPCIVAFAIRAGYRPFLEWITAESLPIIRRSQRRN